MRIGGDTRRRVQGIKDEMDDQYIDSEAHDALRACRDRIKGGLQ